MLRFRCRFDLAGSRDAGRCPECGQAFDPADRLSWADDRSEPLRRKLAGAVVLRKGFGTRLPLGRHSLSAFSA